MGRDKQKLVQLSSLKHTNPVLSLVFAFLVFSRSGIPPFAGFFIKLDILAAAMDSSHFFVTYFLFFCTVVSFFYYLRLIKIMFFDDQVHSDNNAITFSNVYSVEYPINVYRA
jgi:NADH-quinone oxidoreductase subunit N